MEYAGSGAPLPNVSKPQYCLRVYVMDPAATGNYERLSDQLRGWHMVDQTGICTIAHPAATARQTVSTGI